MYMALLLLPDFSQLYNSELRDNVKYIDREGKCYKFFHLAKGTREAMSNNKMDIKIGM